MQHTPHHPHGFNSEPDALPREEQDPTGGPVYLRYRDAGGLAFATTAASAAELQATPADLARVFAEPVLSSVRPIRPRMLRLATRAAAPVVPVRLAA